MARLRADKEIGMGLHIGQKIKVEFPFYTGVHEGYDCTGDFYSRDVWIPGCKQEPVSQEDFEFVAEGLGEMVLEIIDIHKPGKYPERVFYTRRWIDPDGDEFGAGKLHITTTPTFKKRAAGYYHNFRVL